MSSNIRSGCRLVSMAAGDAKSSMTDEERLGTSWKVLLRVPKAHPIRIQSGFVAASVTKKDTVIAALPEERLIGGDWNMTFMFPYILGISSPQLMFIFFRMIETTNQKETRTPSPTRLTMMDTEKSAESFQSECFRVYLEGSKPVKTYIYIYILSRFFL